MADIPHALNAMSGSVVQRFKDQILIALIKRLADDEGCLKIPISEIDDTGQDLLEMEALHEENIFVFKLSKKN